MCGLCSACEFSSSSSSGVIATDVEVVEVNSSAQNIVAEMSDGSCYELTDEALVEGLVIILDDRFSDVGVRPREIPYDLPMMIARYFLKDVKPYYVDDELRKWLIDIESAALGSACPTKAFFDFVARFQEHRDSLVRICRTGYASVCRQMHRLGHKQLARIKKKQLDKELSKAYPGSMFSSFRRWLSERVCATNRLCRDTQLGLFQGIYESIKVESERYKEFGNLVKIVGYPLIATPNVAYCDCRADDVEVRYLMALHTAYMAATNDGLIACDSIPFCQSAANVALNPNAASAPNVQSACWMFPWNVQQRGNYDCAFTRLWRYSKAHAQKVQLGL